MSSIVGEAGAEIMLNNAAFSLIYQDVATRFWPDLPHAGAASERA
jgi:hypothetical protein